MGNFHCLPPLYTKIIFVLILHNFECLYKLVMSLLMVPYCASSLVPYCDCAKLCTVSYELNLLPTVTALFLEFSMLY